MTIAPGISPGIAAAAAFGLAALVALSPAPATAQIKFIDEVKAGGLVHDITFSTTQVESGADINLEMLFTPLFAPVELWGVGVSLRPHLGGAVNTNGDTSKGYFGLTLDMVLVRDLFRPGDGIFLDGSLGGAIHDGFLTNAPPGRKNLGARFLGRRAGELGYQVTPQISVSVIIDHVGNYGFAKPDAGLKTLGGRVGFKF